MSEESKSSDPSILEPSLPSLINQNMKEKLLALPALAFATPCAGFDVEVSWLCTISFRALYHVRCRK